MKSCACCHEEEEEKYLYRRIKSGWVITKKDITSVKNRICIEQKVKNVGMCMKWKMKNNRISIKLTVRNDIIYIYI